MAQRPFDSSTLYYGDNLDVLRKHFPNECIDLVYLDPPFNSKADYNILFKEQQENSQQHRFKHLAIFGTGIRTAEKTYLEIQEDPKLRHDSVSYSAFRQKRHDGLSCYDDNKIKRTS